MSETSKNIYHPVKSFLKDIVISTSVITSCHPYDGYYMAPTPEKRARKVLKIENKIEILSKIQEGWSRARVRCYFGITNTKLQNIIANKEKISGLQKGLFIVHIKKTCS